MIRSLVGRAAATLVVAAPLPGEKAAASCAGPQVAIVGSDERHPTIAAGSAIDVEGRYFVDGCDDIGGGSVLGCSAPEHEPVTPMTGIELRLRQHGREWLLGTADADARLGDVSWTVQAPRELRPGRATLVADGAQPVKMRVVAR